MLYDDDRGGPPLESFGPDDDSQWVVPDIDAAYLRQFDTFDRVLVVLAIAEQNIPGSYPGDQVFEVAGLLWDQGTVDDVIGGLLGAGMIATRQADDGLYLKITAYGRQRVSELTS